MAGKNDFSADNIDASVNKVMHLQLTPELAPPSQWHIHMSGLTVVAACLHFRSNIFVIVLFVLTFK